MKMDLFADDEWGQIDTQFSYIAVSLDTKCRQEYSSRSHITGVGSGDGVDNEHGFVYLWI